jgi:hypothetical protein
MRVSLAVHSTVLANDHVLDSAIGSLNLKRRHLR